MKTLLLSVLVLLCTITTNATNYYFSNTSGDDLRTATQAHSSSTPWKSVNKLNSVFSTLLPGDSILFKRGETFYGSIIINKSGTASSPIIIGAYGSGARPVITTFVTLTGWVANSIYSGVYDCAADTSLPSRENMVIMNGAEQPMGRFPNANAANKGWLTFQSHNGNVSISDSSLITSVNWTRATLVVKSANWIIDTTTITAHSGGTFNYSPALTYTPINNFGYFIQNSIKTLDQLGEWYYNPSLKKVSMYFGSANPAAFSVQAASINNMVYSSGKSNIVFDNITFKGANAEGINIYSGSNNVLQNCDILFSGSDGILASGSQFKVENCTVMNSNNNGIYLNGSSPVVRNTYVKNSYFIAGMGKGGNGNGAGIKNSNGLIELNTIINSGYVGIEIGSNNAIIRNNYIDTVCFMKDDAGGIYTANGSNNTFTGRKVIGNIISNSIGAPEGTNNIVFKGQGIYMDDNSNGVEISGNTITNCSYGIYLHNSRDIVLNNNTFYNNAQQLYAKHDNLGDALRNNTITNNIFFSKLATQIATSINTTTNDIGSIGRLDSNFYARPIDDRMMIFNSTYIYSSAETKSTLDLSGWKLAYNLDASSKRSPKQIAPYKINNLIGTNKIINGDFGNTNVKNVWGNNCTLSWQASGILDSGYLKVVPAASVSSTVINIGAVTASKKYILRFSLKGTSGMSISAYLRSSDYTPLTPRQLLPVSNIRSENEIIFTPLKDDINGSVMFYIDAQSTYYMDNIQLYEVNASTTNPDDSIKFVVNSSQVSKSFTLNGNYIDVANNKYSNSIVLQPYSSAVLIKTNNDIIIPNVAPTVGITTPADSTNYISMSAITINANAADADGSVSKVDFYNGSIMIGSDSTSPYSFTWNNVATGNYTLTAKATDNSGAVTTSNAVTVVVVTPNAAPAVSITSPISGNTFNSPASIIMTANASDADGSVSKVDFYNGSTMIGSDSTSPYSFTWSNVATNNYTLTAKATDNSGAVTTSNVVTVVVVTPNAAPAISITSPISGNTFNSPATIIMTANASDADGSVSKVDFYNGSTMIGSDSTSPYSFTWNNVATGNYTLTAKATDNSGAVTTSNAVTVVVVTPNAAPAVSITSPISGNTFNSPATIIMTANASDADGAVSKVDFYNGSTMIGSDSTSPYSFTWNNVATGNYTLTAKATDNSGAVTTSNVVTVVVVTPNAAPAVSITSPISGNTFNSPATIIMTANASDADGSVSKVDFYNGSTMIGSDSTSPYSFTWSNVATGNYALTAKATDNSGAVTTSNAVTVVVVTPNAAPAISITSPISGNTFNSPATIIMTANASDADGSVSKVDFYNGSIMIGSDSTSPYSFTWSNVATGNYALTAKATDNSGAVTTSNAVTVVVVTPNAAPAVSITSPISGNTFNSPASIIMTANASDADGSVSKVDFYNGSTMIGSDNTSPYSFTWNNVATGNYTLTAKATDNSGAVTTSNVVTVVVVTPNVAPAISITSPISGNTFNSPASIIMTANASDADGSVSKVDFYNGSTMIGSDNTSPYSFTWNNVATGNYTLTAKATDNSGAVTTSNVVTVVVVTPNAAPVVKITTPKTGSIYSGSVTLYIAASATDADGTIKKVEFYNGTILLKTEYSYPYSCSWANVSPGSYKITAKATDNSGNVTTSPLVSVTINVKTTSAVITTSLQENQDFSGTSADIQHKIVTNSLESVSVKISPNPTSDMISVYTNGLQMNKDLRVSILSVTGTVLKTFQTITSNQAVKMNVSSFKNGTYIVQLTSGNTSIYRQFIKN